MARINLLPWREELREERKKRFLTVLVGVLVLSVSILFLIDRYVSNAIEHQMARNAYLQTQIAQLDIRIKEISDLKARRKQLLERMKIIQDLQGNRPVTGRVFDQLARTLPDGVYYSQVKMTSKLIAISGAAESNNRVSDLMRNLEASEWLEAPSLTEVKATDCRCGGSGQRVSADRAPDPASGCRCRRSQAMNMSEWMDGLRKVDFSELDLNNLGSWPAAVKVIAGLLVAVLIFALGYFFFIQDLETQLDSAQAGEMTLREQYSTKAFQAANLEPYKKQMEEMENTFGALLRQLPSDTEVPAARRHYPHRPGKRP